MITYMHCRPPCASDFNFARPLPLAYYYHDQLPASTTPRRRRRLDDPILTYASNYYVSYPPPPSSSPLSLSVPRPVYQPSECPSLYCDLFNLLEHPETAPALGKPKQRRHARPPDAADSVHGRMRTFNDRKRAYHHPHPSHYHKDKKRSEEKSSGKDSDRSRQQMHRRSPPRGFFRRIVRTYFCMPPALTNNGYSS